MTYNRVHESRIEDYTGIPTTDIIPIGQSRWYGNVPGYEGQVVQLTGNDVDTIADLPRLGPPAAVFENPSVGELIPDDSELFLAGDPPDSNSELPSSLNRKPYMSKVDYIPAFQEIDGAQYPSPEKKFDKLGTYPFFDEYENAALIEDIQTSNASVSNDGDWVKVSTTAAGSNCYAYIPINTGLTSGYQYVVLRRGKFANEVGNYTAIFITDAGASIGETRVYWDTRTITLDTANKDLGSFYISDDSEIVVIKLTNIFAATSSSPDVRIRISNITGTEVGDYVYIKNWMFVDNINYPVPYVEGKHEANKLAYNFDWAESDDWTIEFWAQAKTAPSAEAVIFDCLDSSQRNGFRVYISSTESINLVVANDTTSDTGGGGTEGINLFHHVKVVFTSSSIRLYINGLLRTTETVVLPPKSTINKLFGMGSRIALQDQYFNGYISQIKIVPIADTSTDHYNSQKPWYAPNKTMIKNGSASIDYFGNFAGLNLGGRIIFNEELDGQRVVKWDTGMMMLFYSHDMTVNINISDGSLYTSDPTISANDMQYPLDFASIITAFASTELGDIVEVAAVDVDIDKSSFVLFTATSKTSVLVTITGIIVGTW